MKQSRLSRRMTAWMACIAILLSSLAPSISHALAAKSNFGALWTDICTAAGIKNADISSIGQYDSSDSSSTTQQSLHWNDCPYCRLQVDAPGLLPDSEAVTFIGGGSFSFPILFYQSPRPLFAWASAQPRAPPSFS